MSKLTDKLNEMKSGELFDILKELALKFDDHSQTIYSEALDVLETKISSDKFRLACNDLDQILINSWEK